MVCLRSSRFDFNAWVESRVSYADIRPLMYAIVQARVPVVVHHGLLDCCHLLDKLRPGAPADASLPADWPGFLDAWMSAGEGGSVRVSPDELAVSLRFLSFGVPERVASLS